MQPVDNVLLLRGKDEEARIQVAHRVGRCLQDVGLSEADRRATELLASELAKDAVERVRLELSKAVSRARYLPRQIALKIAHDVDAVSCPFLRETEVFSDSDWQQLLLTISRGARISVARRSRMSEALAKSLAESGDPVVAESLIDNPAAPMTLPVCGMLIDGFRSEIWVLDKLALRSDLAAEIAVELTAHVSAAARRKLEEIYELVDFTAPIAVEAEIGAMLQVVKSTRDRDLVKIAETLDRQGKLTSALLLEAVRGKQPGFVEAALSVVAGRSIEHVRSVMRCAEPEALRQLLARARIPAALHEEFRQNLEASRRAEQTDEDPGGR